MAGETLIDVAADSMCNRTSDAGLCRVQVATEQEHAPIHPYGEPHFAPLQRFPMDPGIVKVFHAGRHDLEIFHDIWAEIPAPIFDTQLAATLLGIPSQASYGRLVADLLGVQLDKAGTLTDWARRPLSPEQLRYAADDVIHLASLYPRMRSLLAEQGRLAWLDAEHSALADP